jgi:hypothetical protein
MANRRSSSNAKKWGEELRKTLELQPYDTTSTNSVIAVLDTDFVQADAQPRQITISGIIQSALNEGIIPSVSSGATLLYNRRPALHPLATQGNADSPVTRGELRIILEDLLVKIGSGVPVATAPAPAPVAHTIDTSGADQFLSLGRDAMLQFAKDHNIDVSGALGLDDNALAEFIAASVNAA